MTEKEKRIRYIHENNWESVKEHFFFVVILRSYCRTGVVPVYSNT